MEQLSERFAMGGDALIESQYFDVGPQPTPERRHSAPGVSVRSRLTRVKVPSFIQDHQTPNVLRPRMFDAMLMCR
jgi:hypothetical protein